MNPLVVEAYNSDRDSPACNISYRSYMRQHMLAEQKDTRAAMDQNDRRNKYGFNEFRLGDVWRYFGVPLITIRSAAQMFGQRNGKRFKVWQDGKTVLVERLA